MFQRQILCYKLRFDNICILLSYHGISLKKMNEKMGNYDINANDCLNLMAKRVFNSDELFAFFEAY